MNRNDQEPLLPRAVTFSVICVLAFLTLVAVAVLGVSGDGNMLLALLLIDGVVAVGLLSYVIGVRWFG